MKLSKVFIVLLTIISIGVYTNIKIKENEAIKNQDYKEYATDDFTFKLKNDIEFVRIGKNNWYIFNTKQINKNIITPETIYADTVSVKIEKERVNSEEEFKNKIKENEEQVKNLGGKIINKKKIAKDGYIVYKYEANVPKLNLKSFSILIKINKKVYSSSILFDSNTSLEQKKEKIKILNDILKTIKIKHTHSFYYKISKDILTKKNALEDLEEMRRVLNINPVLYLYRSKEETDNEFMKLREEIEKKEKWEKRELYILFAKFISGINDGHTIMLFDFSEIENPFLLPVIIRNNKVYISKNNIYPETIGGEIESINGIYTRDILNRVKDLVSCDKGREEFKEEIIQREFFIIYQFVYGIDKINEIVYTKDGVEKQLKISKVNFEWPQEKKMFDVKFIDNEIATLEIRRFEFNDIDEIENETILRNKLKDVFKEIKEKNIKNIIVDVRENGGGEGSLVDIFYSFLNELKKDRNTNIYLLTGRCTFSAAVEFSALMKSISTVVGEPTGGRLDMAGNPIYYTLKNSGVEIYIATAYINFSKHLFNSNKYIGPVNPDIRVEIDPIKEAYGEDQVMEKVLELIKEKNKNEI